MQQKNRGKEPPWNALSIDGVGLPNYGPCSLVLREEMISHRSSVFEENSALFMEQRGIKISRAPKVPKGYKATWGERAKLYVAKLGAQIGQKTPPDKYSEILLKQGANSDEDDFVEVHIFGPMTVLTMEEVIITPSKQSQRATILKAIKIKLAKHGVRAS